MKLFLLAILLSFLSELADITAAWADGDPCGNYHQALAYSRTKDATPATLTLSEPKTGAIVEMRLPRNFTAVAGNLTEGEQCMLAFELLWPQMTAGGLVEDSGRRVQDRLIGDMPAWRSLTIDIRIMREAWAPWMVPAAYCEERSRLGEPAARPFGLRALDDRIKWPKHRQSDGSYRDMQELISYPRNSADVFYYIHDDPNEMVRIYCTKGVPSCELQDHFQGFRTTTLFDGDDLVNWRVYRDAVRHFLASYTVRVRPPGAPVDHGVHANASGALSACMWEMEKSIGATTLHNMGFGPTRRPER
jgi:hypothetical protein